MAPHVARASTVPAKSGFAVRPVTAAAVAIAVAVSAAAVAVVLRRPRPAALAALPEAVPIAVPRFDAPDRRDLAIPSAEAAPPVADTVAAEAPKPRTISDEIAEVVGPVERSGRKAAAWNDPVAKLVGELTAAPDALRSQVSLGAPRCFADGCVVEAHYANRAAPRQLETWLLTSSAGFRDFLGLKYRSGPVVGPDGSVTGKLAFFRPGYQPNSP